MATGDWPASDHREPRPARSGCAPLVGIVLLLLLGAALIADLGISSFLCMDSQGDNLACAVGLVGGHLPLYIAGVGVIAVVTNVVRRLTG